MSGTAAPGMQRIPLTLDSYQHQSVPLTSRLLLNMLAEQVPPTGQGMSRVDFALLPVTGLTPVDILGDGIGAGPIHVMNDARPGIIYLVSGTYVYMLNFGSVGPFVSTYLGDVGAPVGLFGDENTFYTIAVGATATVVCSPPNAFVSAGFNGPLQQITTTWPEGGASSVTYLDGYFVFTSQTDPTQFFITELADPTTIDALDFASLDAFPDATLKVETLGTDLWFAGTAGWEIWYDAGNADFPLRRRPNGIIKRPIGRMKSIAQGNEQLFWWSFDNRVYATVGYQEKRISTHAIEAVIMAAGADIRQAYCYVHLGHIFYVMNLPNETLVYDVVGDVWHNRSSGADGTGPWRPACAAQTVGQPFMGDSGTPGRLLLADRNVSTDAGVAVKRQVVLPPLYAGTRRGFCARLEVEMEVGGANTPGDILLEWSDDGGITYTGSRTMNAGTASQTRKRVYTTRLGSFRDRVFRLTSQHALTVYAIDADISVGNH